MQELEANEPSASSDKYSMAGQATVILYQLLICIVVGKIVLILVSHNSARGQNRKIQVKNPSKGGDVVVTNVVSLFLLYFVKASCQIRSSLQCANLQLVKKGITLIMGLDFISYDQHSSFVFILLQSPFF